MMTNQELQSDEILLLPFFGQGHVFPFIEFSKHLSTSLNFATTLLIPSSLSSSIPSSVRNHHPCMRVVEITTSASPKDPPPRPGLPFGPQLELVDGLESFILDGPVRPICVIIDVMMGWAKDVFMKLGIPIVIMFTSGACSAALEYGSWKAHVIGLKPGEVRIIPGLPEEMMFTYSDIKRQAHNSHPPHMKPPGLGPSNARPPPGPGQKPRWIVDVEGVTGIIMNTCHELESPFINYVSGQIEKPVWCVGPLLPEQYLNSGEMLVYDHDVRANKHSNYGEADVIQWMDSKPQGSVLYISFGSEVEPILEEYGEIAKALEETPQPFIWVIQPGSRRPEPPPHSECQPEPLENYNSLALEKAVGNRGLIISGWAPQLIILSHIAIGGFVSHCGWNSVMEAIVRRVPILAWPIRGDQHYNAKLVTSYLQVGLMIKEDTETANEMVRKDDIVRAIQKLKSDASIRRNADVFRANFRRGVPKSSTSAFDAFRKHILAINTERN